MLNKYIDLNAINNMVISLAFTQLFLEGHIEPEVKKWARQHLAEKWFILTLEWKRWRNGRKKVRINQL
jgi:uncharacterized protein YfeS